MKKKTKVTIALLCTGCVLLGVTGTGLYLAEIFKPAVEEQRPTPDVPDDPGDETTLLQPVSFVVNGKATLSKNVATGTTATEPEVPLRAGYTFAGWTRDGLNEDKVAEVIINTPTTFYAMFKKSTDAGHFEFEDGALVSYFGEDKNVVIPTSYSLGEIENVYTEWSDYNTLYAFWNSNQDKMPLTIYDADGTEHELTTDRTSIQSLGDITYTAWAEVPTQTYINGTDICVTTIGANAFISSNVSEITLPRTLKTIENNAFYDCTSLKSIDIPDSVEAVGNRAFYIGSSGYSKTITIGNGVKELGSNLFGYVKATIVIDANEVPTITSTTFESDSIIYVPDTAYVKYLVADVWCDIKEQINPVSEYTEA